MRLETERGGGGGGSSLEYIYSTIRCITLLNITVICYSFHAVGEIGRNLVSRHYNRFSPSRWRMSRLTRDGTTEPVLRDHILRRERGQREIFVFPVQLTTSRIDNLAQLIPTLLCMYVCMVIT